MRTKGHRNTTVSGDTRVDWSEAFALVPSLTVGYVWHAGVHAAEVAVGLERIGFEIASPGDLGQGALRDGPLLVPLGHEPCWVVRKPGIPHLFHGSRDQSTVWRAPSPKMIMGGSDEEKQDHPAQKPVLLYETPIRNHLRPGEAVYDPFVGSGHLHRRRRDAGPALLRDGDRSALRPGHDRALAGVHRQDGGQGRAMSHIASERPTRWPVGAHGPTFAPFGDPRT